MLATAIALMAASTSPAAQTLGWYRGNTHTHTINSDGDAAPDTVVRWYREHDYHFVFITDHEYVTDPAPLNALFGAEGRFLVLPGQEITQWGADPLRSAAHVNSLFTTKLIWPVGERKCIGRGCGAHAEASVPLGDTFKANIAAIRAANGIAQVNHPNYRWSVRPEDLYDIPNGTLLEIWNGISDIHNLGGTDDHGDARPSAEGFWDILLSRGKVIWGVGSDDSHNYGPATGPDQASPGQAWIMVRAPELNAKAIADSLRKGDFYASTGVALRDVSQSERQLAIEIQQPRGPYPPRYVIRFIGTGARVLSEVTGTKAVYRLKGDEGYVRASIVDSDGRRAWTQPVFTDGRSP